MPATTTAEPAPRARPRRPRADALDALVGKRVRERRLALGLTVQELAAALGVPYQQLHKYETGANRLSAGRLFLLAEALRVEVAHFFGEDEEVSRQRPPGSGARCSISCATSPASPTGSSGRRWPGWPAPSPAWRRAAVAPAAP